jgi:hypothetical protein
MAPPPGAQVDRSFSEMDTGLLASAGVESQLMAVGGLLGGSQGRMRHEGGWGG